MKKNKRKPTVNVGFGVAPGLNLIMSVCNKKHCAKAENCEDFKAVEK